MTVDRESPEFAELLGEAICGLARYFVGISSHTNPPPGHSIPGRNKDDAIYMAVTEKRDGPTAKERASYSSCGDQLHAILERLGVRGRFINRGAGHRYGAEQMTRLQPKNSGNPGGCPFALSWPRRTDQPPAGSLCLIWTTGYDAHALVCLGPGSDDKHMLTANYGAAGMSPTLIGGASLADSPCLADDLGQLRVGSNRRILQTVITPAAIARNITAEIDMSGAYITGELADAIGARYDGPAAPESAEDRRLQS